MSRRTPRGLSIVELMVGIAISMFILAGASLVLTTQLDSNRRVLLEAQLQQDLRTTADMISRDVRRAGFWNRSYCDVWPGRLDMTRCATAGGVAASNPYSVMSPVSAATAAIAASRITYARSTDADNLATQNNTEDHLLDNNQAGGGTPDPNKPREFVGFRWNTTNAGRETIDFMVGNNNWQALTDPSVMRVTAFNMVMDTQSIPLATCAGAGCRVLGPCGGEMSLSARVLTFTIVAEAVHDASVRRSIRESVRLRNHLPVENPPCP